MMFRCFLRPGGSKYVSPSWLPSLAGSGSRGIKLSKMGPISKTSTQYQPAALSVSGRGWLTQLAQNDIGDHKECKYVQSMRNIVIIKAATRHVRKHTDDVYLTDVGHPFAEAVVRRYLRDHKEKPLWLITTIHAAEKPIVRGKFKYRAHAAFYQALRNAGYDTAGRKLAGEGTRRTGAASELFGTVMMVTHAPKEIFKTPFEALRGFFGRVVRDLERTLGKTAVGHTAGRESKIPRASSQQPQHQARGGPFKRTDGSNPGNRGPHIQRRGTPNRREGDGGGHQKSGQQMSRQSKLRDTASINTGFQYKMTKVSKTI